MIRQKHGRQGMGRGGGGGGGGARAGERDLFSLPLYTNNSIGLKSNYRIVTQKNKTKKKKNKTKKKKTMCTYSCVFIANCTSVGQESDCVADLNFSVYRGLMPDVMCLFEPSVVLLMVFFSFGCRCRKKTTS